jgi:hypothetical protein
LLFFEGAVNRLLIIKVIASKNQQLGGRFHVIFTIGLK